MSEDLDVDQLLKKLTDFETRLKKIEYLQREQLLMMELYDRVENTKKLVEVVCENGNPEMKEFGNLLRLTQHKIENTLSKIPSPREI